MSGFSKWAEGEVISGGDLAEYCGREQVSETDQARYGITPTKGVSEERIRELIKRGVLRGIGDDAVMQPEAPVILQPTFDERAAIGSTFDIRVDGDAQANRKLELSKFRNRRFA